MAFLPISQEQGGSGKNEQSTQTPWRGAPEARVPMQLHRLHRLKAGPDRIDATTIAKSSRSQVHIYCLGLSKLGYDMSTKRTEQQLTLTKLVPEQHTLIAIPTCLILQ